MNLSLSDVGVTAYAERDASATIVALLNQQRLVGGFEIRYLLRSSARRHTTSIAGGNAHTVRSMALVDLYAAEIEWVVSLFRNVSLTCPLAAPVPVYVLDPVGCWDLEPTPQVITGLPLRGRANTFGIVLPNRTSIPSHTDEQAYFRAAAVHEATHVICFSQSKLNTVPGNGWRWFSEGTAEWVALKRLRQLAPSNVQTFEFLGDWIAYPAIPINLVNTWYSSCIFVDYLVRRRNLSWLAALWKNASAGVTDDPWHAIKQTFGADVFLQFSCDAYFLNDPKNIFYSPDVFARFGPRAPERSYRHSTSGPVTDTVYDFGCRYYAIQSKRRGQVLHIRFGAKDETVCATLTGSTNSYHRIGKSIRLSPGATAVDTTHYPNVDHFVLVVTTAPVASHTADLPQPHEFTFEAH